MQIITTLLSLFSVVSATTWSIDCAYDQIWPATVLIEVGDTVTWYYNGTDQSSLHLIETLLPDFSGVDPNGPINSGVLVGDFTFSMTFGASTAGQEFLWGDVLNIYGASFGHVYVKDGHEVFIHFTVFSGNPAISTGFALEPYPKNVQISNGTRVIWEAVQEPLINHVVLFADKQFHALIGSPFDHPMPFNRRSPYFAYRFTSGPQKQNYICAIHDEMRGTVTVCDNNGHNCPHGDD